MKGGLPASVDVVEGGSSRIKSPIFLEISTAAAHEEGHSTAAKFVKPIWADVLLSGTMAAVNKEIVFGQAINKLLLGWDLGHQAFPC